MLELLLHAGRVLRTPFKLHGLSTLYQCGEAWLRVGQVEKYGAGFEIGKDVRSIEAYGRKQTFMVDQHSSAWIVK